MYIPESFVGDGDAIRDLLDNQGVADLITMTARGLVATALPFEYDSAEGEYGTLIGHVARANPHWQEKVFGEAMVIVRGPDAYITPSWYPTKAQHHRVVPTWNYITAHIYGELVVHDDAKWTEKQIRRLTDRHEAGNADPWSIDQAPAEFIETLLQAVVGVEVLISRIEAKFKLSQNQSAENIEGVIGGLSARSHNGDQAMAAAMRKHNLTRICD